MEIKAHEQEDKGFNFSIEHLNMAELASIRFAISFMDADFICHSKLDNIDKQNLSEDFFRNLGEWSYDRLKNLDTLPDEVSNNFSDNFNDVIKDKCDTAISYVRYKVDNSNT